MSGAPEALLSALLRRTAVVALVAAGVAWIWRPGSPRIALGVVGGGLLAMLATWAIGGAVAALGAGSAGQGRAGGGLVKFFTRHAIVGLVAYGMMVRLRLDAVGMLIGVTSVVVAAALVVRRPRH